MPSPCVPLLMIALAGTDLLGTPLHKDGYRLSPPAGFRVVRSDPFAGSRVGAVGTGGGSLSAALVEGQGPQAASLLVAVVDGSLEAGPAARDEFAAAVARHFREELGLEFSLDTVEWVPGPAARLEVRGSVRQEGQLRYVLVAGMEGAERHVVITFSVPSGRWADLQPALRASLDSFEVEPRPLDVRGAAGVIAGAVSVALALSLHLRRRRLARRRAEAGQG